jgi:hypothetical protein
MLEHLTARGLDRVRGEIERTGRYATKSGHTIKRLGRPGAEPHKVEQAKALLAATKVSFSEFLRYPYQFSLLKIEEAKFHSPQF